MPIKKRQCIQGIASTAQENALTTFSANATQTKPKERVPPFVQNPETWRGLSPAELKNPNQDLEVCLDPHLKGILHVASIGNHTYDLNKSKDEFFKAVVGGLSKHRSGNAEKARTIVRLMDVGLQIARNIILMGANPEKSDKRDLRHVENVDMEDFAHKSISICQSYLRYKNIPSASLAPKQKTYRTEGTQTSETLTDQIMESQNGVWAQASKLLSGQPTFDKLKDSYYSFNDDVYLELEQVKQRLLENNQELKKENFGLKEENILLQRELKEARDTIRKLEAEKLAGNAFVPDASLEFLSLADASRAQDKSLYDSFLPWEEYDPSLDPDPFYEVLPPYELLPP